MPKTKTMLSIVTRVLIGGALSLIAAGTACAESYAFNQFLSGGGGGTDPAKKRTATSMGAYICVNVSPGAGPAGPTVNFMVISMIPQLKSRVGYIVFDTGRHTDLFNNITVLTQPHGLKATAMRPEAHAFLPRLTPDYGVGFSYPGGRLSGTLAAGLAPGQSILISASLGSGKSFADVIRALNEGLNPSTAATGLRMGVIVLNLLGGPPKGVASIQDDGGFVSTAATAQCGRS